jgi:predicted alpha/beta-hydrolase family hydrolase
MVQPSQPFSFAASGSSDIVEGVLHAPFNPSPWTPALIVCHGLSNNMNLPLLIDLCREAAEAGLYAVRFNFRYVTRQASPAANGSAESADLEGALAAVQTRLKLSPGRTYLAGKSLGAVVAGRVAVAHPGLGGYIALGYPLHRPGGAVLDLPKHLAHLGCPALFVVGDRDPYCRLEALQPVLETIPTSWALAKVAHGDHSFRPPQAEGEEYLAQAVEDTLAWITLQCAD